MAYFFQILNSLKSSSPDENFSEKLFADYFAVATVDPRNEIKIEKFVSKSGTKLM